MKIETHVHYDGNVYITDPIIDKLVNSFIARDACEIVEHDNGDGGQWDEFQLVLDDGTRVKGSYVWGEPGFRTLEINEPVDRAFRYFGPEEE